MELIPTHDEVVDLLREAGALRTGHFAYPNRSAFEGLSSGCARDALFPARQSS